MASAGGHWLKIDHGVLAGTLVFVAKDDNYTKVATKISLKSGVSMYTPYVKQAAQQALSGGKPVAGTTQAAPNTTKVAKGESAPLTGGSGFKSGEEIYGSHAKIADKLGGHFEGHAKSLTDAEAATLYDYQGAGFVKVNKALWKPGGKVTLSTKQQIADLDAVMKKSPGLPKDQVLSRSTTKYHPLFKLAQALSVGDTYIAKGFDSTGAYSHASEKTTGVLIRFNAPKGLKGFFMQAKGYKARLHELEYLLPRNLKWKVVGKTNSNGLITLDLAFEGY